MCNVQSKGKGKDWTLPRKAQRGVQILLLFSVTSVLDGGGVNATPRPLHTRERDTVLIVLETGWTAGPVWTGEENLASTGIPSLDRTSRSESLHQLSSPGALTFTVTVWFVTHDVSIGRFWCPRHLRQPLVCWDCGFEFRRRHGCLSWLLRVVR
jgi:hypothetical protein